MTRRIAIFAVFAVLAACAIAQQPDTSDQAATRRLWDADFLSHRPAGIKPGVNKASSDDAYVGITLWRLRPSMTDDDSAVRVKIKGAKGMEEWTPERISTGTPLMEGEKIRIGIESARAGYLYVFNRWLTARGMIGLRSVIFPAKGVQANRVKAGEVVVLPSPHDEPAYFEIKPGRQDRIYEMYTVLISQQPMPAGMLGPGLITMASEPVEDWESRLRTRVRRLEQPWLAGQAATHVETDAGSGGLTQDDPLPQDLYHAEAKPGDPMLVDVLLNICPTPVTSVLNKPSIGRFGGVTGNSPKRMTASSFLVPLQSEAAGYGLYSYVLFGARPESLGSDRWRRYYEAILAFLTIPSSDEMSRYARPEALNITYLPIVCSAHELPRDSLQPRAFSFDKARLAAHAMEHQADGRKFSGHSLSNVTTACTLVSNYDYPRAQRLLSALPETHMEGPYIISVAQPLGKTLTLPAEYLYQDLSSVPPELIGLWLREFMAQAQEREFWKTRPKEQFVLRLRTAIGIVSQQIPDVGSKLTWAFTTVTPK